MNKATAIILAGGVGQRMCADRPKQYIEVQGETILQHTLRAFSGMVSKAVVVCQDEWSDLVLQYATPQLPLTLAKAGATGFESLRNGIAALDEEPSSSLILIHDAVRPLVNKTIIADNLRVARECGNAITAIGIYETLLQAPDATTVRGMTRREHMYRAQTPQTFSLGTLRQMIQQADDRCVVDAQSACTLAAQLGYELHLSQGELTNFKITTSSDLHLYEALIS